MIEYAEDCASYLISSGPLSRTSNYQIIVRGSGALTSQAIATLIRKLEIDREILAECENVPTALTGTEAGG